MASNKDASILIRLKESEAQKIRTVAEQLDLTVPEYIRTTMMKQTKRDNTRNKKD